MDAQDAPWDCETCPRRLQIAALDAENRQALQLYEVLSRRVVQDLGLVPAVFDAYDVRVTRANAKALIDRLDLIHDARQPVRRDSGIGEQES